MQLVASRVQIKQTAVSYPGVGRFRRAETGILGRAIKGVPLGLPFLFAHWYSRPALSGVNLESAAEKSRRDAGVTEWHARRNLLRGLQWPCLCDIRRNTEMDPTVRSSRAFTSVTPASRRLF